MRENDGYNIKVHWVICQYDFCTTFLVATISTPVAATSLSSTSPVSYTHLDVYKRQMFCNANCSITALKRTQTCDIALFQCRSINSNPVSYTHLNAVP